MMRFLRRLLKPLPSRLIPTDEQTLRERRRQLDVELEAAERLNRQRSAIFLLEQEVQAVTAGRFHHRARNGSTT